MNKESFNYLCHELQSYISKHLRKTVGVDKQIATTLWRLATNIEYWSMNQLLGCSTVCTIILETCKAITEFLLPKFVKIPQGESCKEVIDGFDCLGFPQTVGAVNGIIPKLHLVEDASDYYNYKGFHSIITQGSVDHRGIFINVYIEWPGQMHDSCVFKNSDLYKKASRGQLLPSTMDA